MGKKKKKFKLVKRKRKRIYKEELKVFKDKTIEYFEEIPENKSLGPSFAIPNSSLSPQKKK